MMKIIEKKNYKILIGFILGIIVSGVIVYAATLGSDQVSYDNKATGMKATTMQGALDELYEKVDIRKSGKFVSAFSYNETSCVTGEEDACKRTTCYQNKAAGSCKAGDIIKYKVNDTDIITFHVMYDHGSTMTMQTQKDTIGGVLWYRDMSNTRGPTEVLRILERTTAGWTNVDTQTYRLGETSLSGQGAFTGCSSYNSCTSNAYTLSSRSVKARMITVQEAASLGCTATQKSCPTWMYNYLSSSSQYGYWTSSATLSYSEGAWTVNTTGELNNDDVPSGMYNTRAVVVVSK